MVASKVNALAEQTAKATGEIGQLISGIQAFLVTGRAPDRFGHAPFGPSGLFPCKDGHAFILNVENHQWQGLLDRGILVRDVGLDGWLRVSVGTTEECDQFLTAMKEVIAR